MSIHIARTIYINAPSDRVWAVMTDVESWPEWTESMKSAERLDSGPFGTGSKARLRIRRAPAAGVWEVTELTEGRSFAWENRSAGVHGVAEHVIEPDGSGSKVTLTVMLSGLMATLLAPIIAGASRDNVRMEAEGLKRRCESGPSPSQPA